MTPPRDPAAEAHERAVEKAFSAYWMDAVSEGSQYAVTSAIRAYLAAMAAAGFKLVPRGTIDPLPIEAAPKDGTPILLWWGDEYVIGSWLKSRNGWMSYMDDGAPEGEPTAFAFLTPPIPPLNHESA